MLCVIGSKFKAKEMVDPRSRIISIFDPYVGEEADVGIYVECFP